LFWRCKFMRCFIFILVAAMTVAFIGCEKDASKAPLQGSNQQRQETPKDDAKKDVQKESEISPELRDRIGKLIMQLGDQDVKQREAAQAELIKIGKPALPQLDKAAGETGDAEVRNRAAAMVARLRPFTPVGKNEQGCEEYRHEPTGMVFVKIPGGKFRMGSEYEFVDNEKPVHEVKVDGFLIAKYEVTQAVWRKVMESNPSAFKGEDNPVENVSWNACDEFCKKTGLRLPTEAEWEYACRGDASGEAAVAYMWYEKNSGDTTHPVGRKKPNGYGLYDMSGNVEEWCADSYCKDYSVKDKSGDFRVLRGSSWGDSVEDCRSSCRTEGYPAGISSGTGFRCVLDPR
jgi:formylglycine-generating enzyme required for sulfatase activity